MNGGKLKTLNLGDMMMKTETQIVLVVGCILFTIWSFYLLLMGQSASGSWYSILTICIWFIMSLYFGKEFIKDFKSLQKGVKNE